MINYLEKTGKTEEEAIAAALRELQMERDDVSVEIVERAKSGFLGIGAQRELGNGRSRISPRNCCSARGRGNKDTGRKTR